MKKIVKGIMITLCLAVAVAFAMNANTDVSAKSKVTCKLKKGTLTIKGKGEMPKKLKFKKKKVKKIVIKKGVKSISNNAFKGCTKAKKITIASSVKKIGTYAFSKTAVTSLKIPAKATKLGVGFIDNCKKLDTLTIPGKFDIVNKNGTVQPKKYAVGTTLETVTFNTALDLNNTAYFDTYNFVTAASEPTFKDYSGVLYTKNGAEVVRVPSGRSSVTLLNSCTVFNTYAVTYTNTNGAVVCNDLKVVTIPASVQKVDEENYADELNKNKTRDDLNIEFEGSKTTLTIPEVVKLKNRFKINVETLMKKLPGRIVQDEDKNYVGDTKYLVQVSSTNAAYKVPDVLTVICDKAFVGSSVKDLDLNKVVEIGDNAFSGTPLATIENLDNVTKIGKGAFKSTVLTEVALPKAITAVPDDLFYNCQALKTVKFNGSVTSIGEEAFAYTIVDVNDVLKTTSLKTIGKKAFYGTYWAGNVLTVPAYITTIGSQAFATDYNNRKMVTVNGNTSGFEVDAFGTYTGITYIFDAGIGQAWTSPYHDWIKRGKKVELDVYWDKVTLKNNDAVSGYEIWIAKNKNLTKGVKKYTAKYNQTQTFIKIKKKKAKGLKYFGIRPVKKVSGKNTYGKWTINKL